MERLCAVLEETNDRVLEAVWDSKTESIVLSMYRMDTRTIEVIYKYIGDYCKRHKIKGGWKVDFRKRIIEAPAAVRLK